MADLQRVQTLLKMLESDSHSNAVFELVDLYLNYGIVDAAVDVARTWNSNNPDSEDGQVLLARVYLRAAQYDEVRSVLQKFDESTASLSRMLIEIELEIRQGNFNLAESRLLACRQRFGDPVELQELHDTLEQEKSHSSASDSAEPLIVTPTMADLYFRQGLVEKALVLYLKLLENEPENTLYQNRIQQIHGERSCSVIGQNLPKIEEHHQTLNRWLEKIERRRTNV
nr:hypothetical protein [uncultured Desulfuromonas sp.]